MGTYPQPHQPQLPNPRHAYPNDPTIRGRGRSGRPWERAKAQVYREETHCWLCHQPVDQTLDPRHPMSRSVDHLHTLHHGGHPLARTNHRLTHRRCNTIRGNKLRSLNINDCACRHNMPCAPQTTTSSTLIVDANTI